MYSVDIKVCGKLKRRIETKDISTAYKAFYEVLDIESAELSKKYENFVIELVDEKVLLQYMN